MSGGRVAGDAAEGGRGGRGGQPGAPPLGPGGEFDRIRRYLAAGTAPRRDVRLGPGDDCAVVAGDGIAISTDLAIEGTHFRRDWVADDEIGWRAAAGALGDLAAVAARPIGVLASLAVPAGSDVDDAAIMGGVRHAAAAVGAVLLGGDLTRSPGPVAVDVVVVGEAPAPVRRSGARPGDELWVTGDLGAAAAAVEAWVGGGDPPPAAREAYASPRPRTEEARWLAGRDAPTALIDLSDGLAGDAAHLAAASAVAIVIEPDRVPVHPDAAMIGGGRDAALRLALGGGEDYELLFSASAGAVKALAGEFERRFGLRLRRVGEVREGRGVHVVGPDGTLEPPRTHGYRHFEDDAP